MGSLNDEDLISVILWLIVGCGVLIFLISGGSRK